MSTTMCFRRESRGASNEYPQCMFSSRNKKNIDTFFFVEKSALSRAMEQPHLFLWGNTKIIFRILILSGAVSLQKSVTLEICRAHKNP